MAGTCLPFIRSGQTHLARHNESGKETRQTEEEVGRQHQGMNRPGVRQVPEGSGEKRKMEETGCEVIYGAPTTLAVKVLFNFMFQQSFTNIKKVIYVVHRESYFCMVCDGLHCVERRPSE